MTCVRVAVKLIFRIICRRFDLVNDCPSFRWNQYLKKRKTFLYWVCHIFLKLKSLCGFGFGDCMLLLTIYVFTRMQHECQMTFQSNTLQSQSNFRWNFWAKKYFYECNDTLLYHKKKKNVRKIEIFNCIISAFNTIEFLMSDSLYQSRSYSRRI